MLDDAKARGLPLLPGKYYLADGGYGLGKYVLTPYRGVRYHLIEFDLNGHGPANSKELFNLRHSSPRNTVERLFGVCKRRFPMLVKMSPYPFEFQCHIVQCCFSLHNFVRLNQLYEDEFFAVDNNDVPDNAVSDDDVEAEEGGAAMNALKAWWNGITDAMWAQYQIHLANL